MKKFVRVFRAVFLAAVALALFSCESTKQKTVLDDGAETSYVAEKDGSEKSGGRAQIKKQLQDIKITVVSSPKETVKGKAFAVPYKILVTNKENVPYSAFKITAEYPSSRNAESISFSKETLVTAEDGTVTFTAPLPEFSVNSNVSFYPEVPSSDPEIIRLCTSATVQSQYKVRTNLGSYQGILVSIVDYRQNGNIALGNGAQPSTQALEAVLWKNRLMGAQNADFHNSIDADDTAKIQSDALKLIRGNGNFIYVVYGRVKYASEITKDADGYFNVTFNGDLGALNIKTGEVVLKTFKTVTVKDKTEWKLITTAQQEMARLFGEELLYAL